MASRYSEGWKTSGLLKGAGIPAPTGQHTVGCVDLMHRVNLEGDSDSVFVRLFYPSIPLQERAAGYEYAKWTPHKRYTKGFMEFNKIKMPGLVSGLINLVMDPRIPAFDSAPLFEDNTKIQPVKTSESSTTEDPPREPVTSEATNGDAATHKEESVSADDPSTDNKEQSSPTRKMFPVIVFSHGLGAMRTVYSAICCDMASHGYVVAAVEHRDRSACITLKRVPKPGGEPGELVDHWLEFHHRPENEKEFPLRNGQVKQRASEVRQALDLLHQLNNGADIHNMLEGNDDFDYGKFRGRLDVATAAVMGHSFGGATTIQVLSEDPRFLCGIGLDTWMLPIHRDILNVTGIEQPLLFINSFDFQWKDNIQKMMKLVKSPDERGKSSCSLITLKYGDTNHYNQCDVLFVMPVSRKMSSRIPPPLAHQINQELCHTFFKRHLVKDPQFQQKLPNLDGGEGCSEYIVHGTNVDISEPQANVSAEKQGDKGDGEGGNGGAGNGGNEREEQNSQSGEQQGENATSSKEAETATDPRQDSKDTQTNAQNSIPEQAKL